MAAVRFPGCDRPPDWCETHHVVAVGRRRPHRPGKSHFGLRISPSRAPQTRLDLPHHQRRPALATRLAGSTTPKPRAETPPTTFLQFSLQDHASADPTSPAGSALYVICQLLGLAAVGQAAESTHLRAVDRAVRRSSSPTRSSLPLACAADWPAWGHRKGRGDDARRAHAADSTAQRALTPAGSRQIEHLGSAHSDAKLAALKLIAARSPLSQMQVQLNQSRHLAPSMLGPAPPHPHSDAGSRWQSARAG